MEPLRPLAGGGTQVNDAKQQRGARAKRCHLTSTSPRAGKKRKGSWTRKEGDCGEEAWPTCSSSSERASYTGSTAILLRGEGKKAKCRFRRQRELPLPPYLPLPARVLFVSRIVRRAERNREWGEEREESFGIRTILNKADRLCRDGLPSIFSFVFFLQECVRFLDEKNYNNIENHH